MFFHILREQILILSCCEIHFIASTSLVQKMNKLRLVLTYLRELNTCDQHKLQNYSPVLSEITYFGCD